MDNLTKPHNKILRIIALAVVVAFSAETCLWAAPDTGYLTPVRGAEDQRLLSALPEGQIPPHPAGRHGNYEDTLEATGKETTKRHGLRPWTKLCLTFVLALSFHHLLRSAPSHKVPGHSPAIEFRLPEESIGVRLLARLGVDSAFRLPDTRLPDSASSPAYFIFAPSPRVNMLILKADGGYPGVEELTSLRITIDFISSGGKKINREFQLAFDGNKRQYFVVFSGRPVKVKKISLGSSFCRAEVIVTDIHLAQAAMSAQDAARPHWVGVHIFSNPQRWVSRVKAADLAVKRAMPDAFSDVFEYVDFVNKIDLRNAAIKSALGRYSGVNLPDAPKILGLESFAAYIFIRHRIIIDGAEKISQEGRAYLKTLFGRLPEQHLNTFDSMEVVGDFRPFFIDKTGTAPDLERMIMVQRDHIVASTAHEIGHKVFEKLLPNDFVLLNSVLPEDADPRETFASNYELWVADSLKAISQAQRRGQNSLKILAVVAKTFLRLEDGMCAVRVYSPSGKRQDVAVELDGNNCPKLSELRDRMSGKKPPPEVPIPDEGAVAVILTAA